LMRRVADDDPRWRQSAFGYGCNAAERMDLSLSQIKSEHIDDEVHPGLVGS
jgi:hypothetical protein